jgi:hypothetical protein
VTLGHGTVLLAEVNPTVIQPDVDPMGANAKLDGNKLIARQ